MKKFYTTLGVAETATPEEIKKAFRKLSKEHHPDKGGDQEKFKEINEAYQTLSDPGKKQAYDSGMNYIAPAQPVVPNIVIRHFWSLANIKDGGKFKVPVSRVVTCTDCQGIGSKVPGSVTRCSACSGQGKVIRDQVTAFGHMRMETFCPSCMGQGETNTNPCPTCNGAKQQSVTVEEIIEIPKNTLNYIVIPGKGHKVIHGTSDLVIQLAFKDPSGVLYDGSLHKQVTVDFFEALLGHSVNTFIGDTEIKVNLPKETTEGKKLKLSKAYCGLDVIIHVHVPFPSIKQLEGFITDLFSESAMLQEISETLKNKLK